MLTRREFLASAAAVPLAAPRYRPQLAAGCYVWTQVFNARKQTLAEAMPEMFADLRAAGYKRVELMQQFFTPERRGRTTDLAQTNRIEIPIVYAGGVMHEAEQAQRTIEQVQELADFVIRLGTRLIDVNPNPKADREAKTAGELDVQARSVNRLSAALSERGMKLILHHHNPEMADNAREWRHLLKNTDAKVGLCPDIDWMIRGGQNPMELLKEAGSRIAAMHLRNSSAGVWTESLDQGEYDYPSIAKFLRAAGFDGYLTVELAHEKGIRITRGLDENMRLSRLYVEKLFGPLR